MESRMHRRRFCKAIAASVATSALACDTILSAEKTDFRLRPILASCMYGTTKLSEILPEVRKIGSDVIDIWPRVHGDQREQIEEMGHDAFRALLEKHKVRLGILTQYKLGPFGLHDEMDVARKFGAKIIISGSGGQKGLQGAELKKAVVDFLKKMEPHVARAEKLGVTIGIENHSGTLLSSADSVRWFHDLKKSPSIGIALAPYHLPQDAKLLAGLIDHLGSDGLVHFYAWQYGKGCHKKLPKEQELEQMPGRGELDFKPMVAALKRICYGGWTEVFMHPVPRGIPILETTPKVTAEINRSSKYLERCLKKA